jgi:hypothetical protein
MIIRQGEVNGIVEAREDCFICLSHTHTHTRTHARTLLLEIPKRLRMEDGKHVFNRKLKIAQNAS